jgi:hypothetical protein
MKKKILFFYNSEYESDSRMKTLLFPLSIERSRKKPSPKAASFVLDKLKSLIYGLDPFISHSTSRTSSTHQLYAWLSRDSKHGKFVVSALSPTVLHFFLLILTKSLTKQNDGDFSLLTVDS